MSGTTWIADAGGQGTNIPGAATRVDDNLALRASLRPLDYLRSGGGFYRQAVKTGTLATIAANGPIFSMLWTNATLACAILKLKVRWTVVAYTSAILASVSAYTARAFTVADSGGTDVTPATKMQMKRTSMPDSVLTKMLISATAVVTAGTRTLDTNPFANWNGWASAAGIQSPVDATDIFDNALEYPILLAANEGIVIQNDTALSSNVSLSVAIEVAWAEIDPLVIL